MKILIDGRFYGLENAGLGRYTIELIDNLQKIDTKNKYFLMLNKKYFNKLNLLKNWEKILVNSKHYSFSEQIEIPKIVNKIKPDFTHYLHFNVPLFSPRPYLVTIHDMIMHSSKGLSSTTLPWYLFMIKRIGYKISFWKTVKSAKKIISPSETVKKELKKYFNISKNKIVLVPLGINEKFFNTKKVKKENYFLYVGNAYPHKNLVHLIKAVKKINAKLVIVTSRNIFYKRLKKEIEKNKANTNVDLLSYVEDEKLFNLYKKATAFVYPSLIEGFGFQGLEAMASNTLVLCSDIEIFREMYKNNAVYFNPKSMEDIANSLEKVINMRSSEKEKRLQKAQNHAKNFTWSQTAKQTLNIYEELLER